MSEEAIFWLMLSWHLLRHAARYYGSWKCKPIPVPDAPKLRPDCVSVIMATIDGSEETIPRLRAMLDNHPKEIIIVTTSRLAGGLKAAVQKYLPKTDCQRIQVLDIPRPSKRKQLVRGIQAANGEVFVLVDDDVYWASTCLQQLLAVFEWDPKIGGVSTLEEGHGLEERPAQTITMWEAFEARRLSVRNFRISASAWIDHSVSVLSGRTAAYRASILKDPEFLARFPNEYWLGRYYMHSGDDQFITRWLLNHGWDAYTQTGVVVYCTALDNSRHVSQLIRWARNGRRSQFKRLFSKRMWRECVISIYPAEANDSTDR